MTSMAEIETIIPKGNVVVHRMISGKEIIGEVIICIYDDYIEVINIRVEKKHRGKGHAQELVKYIQDNYGYIVTGWQSSETAGRNLFLKMGFVVKKAMHKARTTNLEWKVGDSNGLV